MAALALFAFTTPAHAEWREATSAHFIIYSNGSEGELVRYSKRLEAVHWVLSQATGVAALRPGPKVRIYLVSSTSDVHAAMGVGGNSDVAGFYTTDPLGAYAVAPRDSGAFSQQILFHEYAHHFMFQYMSGVFPPWFTEGFAEVASTTSFERPGTVTWGKVNNARQAELERTPWTPVSTVFASRAEGDERRGFASYGEYWLLTHYLLFAPSRRGQLRAYVQAIGQGASDEEAARAFTGGLQQLDHEARIYLRTGVFEYREPSLPPEVMQSPAVRLMRPGEGESLSMSLRAHRHMPAAERTRLLARIADAQARWPTEPTIPMIAARAHYAGENWTAAETSARHALALDPANIEARVYAILSSMRARKAAETLGSSEALLARNELIAASRAAPGNPMVLSALHESFEITGQVAPVMAIDRLAQAMQLSPQNNRLRLAVAQSLIRVRLLPQARAALVGLAFNPHGGRASVRAQQLISWIDAGADGDIPSPSASDEEED